ncbi:hypothetical protein DL96DRAFT_1471450 [Flagelloscypha sp. PMI_526]|nr:hypothetical protein DL96DRAFT_1471450 [Flagelloscypha sp. PMI_526]
MLEGTILESYLLGANFRRALSRPNCPVIIQELNALLHKVYPKKRSDSHDAPSSTRPNADNIAYFHWHGATYSPSSTHLGNSVVCYRRPGDDNLSAGQIARIFTKDGQTTFEIQRHQSLTPNQHDPFVRFPYLRATTWATTLESAPEKIPLENIFAHGVRYDFSNNRSVIINLDSVSCTLSSCIPLLLIGFGTALTSRSVCMFIGVANNTILISRPNHPHIQN